MSYRRRRQRREKVSQPVQAVAAPAKKPAPSAAELIEKGQCPYCPKKVKDFKSAGGFKTHVRYCAKKAGVK